MTAVSTSRPSTPPCSRPGSNNRYSTRNRLVVEKLGVERAYPNKTPNQRSSDVCADRRLCGTLAVSPLNMRAGADGPRCWLPGFRQLQLDQACDSGPRRELELPSIGQAMPPLCASPCSQPPKQKRE